MKKTGEQSSKHRHTSDLSILLAQLMASLIFFMAMALTVLDAGLALNTHGSFVKGFTPLRAGVAGFFFSFKFKTPPNLKDPFFFNWSAATLNKPSTAAFTSFGFKPALSATELYAPDAVMAPAFMAFMAFMPFMVSKIYLRGWKRGLKP